MKRTILRFLLLTAPLIVILSGCGQAPQGNPYGGAVAVNTFEVKPSRGSYYDFYPGTVTAFDQVLLNAEVGGYLTGVFVKDGQPVRKGQKLYEIERSKYAAAYQQAIANVQSANAILDRSQRDADRYASLLQQNAISKQIADHAQTDLASSKAQVAAANAQLNSAITDLNHSEIYAPFDGVIGISSVKLGTYVIPGQTQLNSVSTESPIAVDFFISEKDLGRFQQLQKVPISTSDSTFSLVLPDNSIYTLPGHISAIDRAIDPQTGTIKVRLSFPNPNATLRAGMSATVRVKGTSSEGQVLIPYKTVIEQMGEYFVYVAEKDTARQHKVTLGAVVGDQVIAQEGVKNGDLIITDGIQKLRDGSAIVLGDPQQGPPQGAPKGAPKKAAK